MLLENLKTSRCILLKNNIDTNVLPILIDTASNVSRDAEIVFFNYDQQASLYELSLGCSSPCINYNPDGDPGMYTDTNKNIAVFIDSFNQMSLLFGLQHSFKCIHNLLKNSKVVKLFIIYHTDCQKLSKVEANLEHVSQLVITPCKYIDDTTLRIEMQYKKGAKDVKSTEDVHYHAKGITASVVSKKQAELDMDQVFPHTLTTFKISLENNEIVARNQLQLPYLKTPESGKVYYEQDAADDWDDEDPDEDLDI